jgi:hypothetical protein
MTMLHRPRVSEGVNDLRQSALLCALANLALASTPADSLAQALSLLRSQDEERRDGDDSFLLARELNLANFVIPILYAPEEREPDQPCADFTGWISQDQRANQAHQ